MKKSNQIHLYISEIFYQAIKNNASHRGLNITMYIKHVLIKETELSLYEISRSKRDLLKDD